MKFNAIQYLAAMALPAAALAQTGPDLLLKPWQPGERVELAAYGTFLGDGSTDNADADLTISIFDSFGRAKLPVESRAEPRVGYNVTYLDLDGDDPALPAQLVDTSFGFGMGVASIDGWLAGLTVGFGYAGAGAFDDGNAWYAESTFAVGKELDETQSLGFVLNYDGNRPFMPDVPLPGFQYVKKLPDRITAAIGFPFTYIQWEPTAQSMVKLTYIIPFDFAFEAEYRPLPELGLFASYSMRTEAFHSDALPNSIDRLLYEQRRVEAGARWRPTGGVAIVLAGGYAFGQQFDSGFDVRDTDEVAELSDEPYLRAGLELGF